MRWTNLRLSLAVFALLSTSISAAQDAKRDSPPESATDPTSRGGGVGGSWMRQHEQFLERLKPGTTDLIFVGDSITQGWGGAGRATWERYYAPRKAMNLGIGGDRTQHVLWRLDHGELDGIHPKVAVVMIGTNNIRANSPDEVVAGIKLVIQRLRDKLPKTKVLLLAVFPRGEKPDATRDRVRAVNDQIKSLDDGKTVKYLDIAATLVNPDGMISKEVMPDYLHLSSKGYRLWAEAIEPTLWELMEDE